MHYLILQYPYDTVQIALCKNGKIIQEITEHKHNAIRATIPNVQALLDQHNLQLQEIACIGVNVGPGPYNTLRALLTMANGIHFAAKTPLISLSALTLLELEAKSENSLVILHAFLGHIFYRLKINTKIIEASSDITELINLIQTEKISSPLLTLGNGAIMHKQILLDTCRDKLIFSEQIPAFNSMQTLTQATYEKLQKNDFEKKYLQPIYFDDLAKK